MRLPVLLACLVVAAPTQAADRELRFRATEGFLPALKNIVVTKSGAPGPGAAKHQAVATATQYKEAVKLPGDGPYDIWWQAKDGIAVRVLRGLKVLEGETKEVKIDDHVGIVAVRGDGQPRAALVTVAAQDDPGPDEKGHIPVQTAKDYRVEMVVPEGFYALWITPENGARPRKVNDRFKVPAGKAVTLD